MSDTPAPVESPRLLLLDGHSLAYRAFFALPVENFSTTTGQPTNAVYGFTSMLINTLKDERPTHLCVAFDVSRKTFRSERFPEYKANRSASPDEFRGQVDLVHDVLDAMDIQHVEIEGYEADDIIATLAKQGGEAGMEVLILSGDRDTLQLVDGNTTVLYPRKGVSDLARMTPEAVEAKYKVGPREYSDLAAIVGESSDNLPGVPGVGPGFASKWINAYGDLAGIVSHAAELPGKKGEAFREHQDQVVLNRELNALVLDLDLPLTLNELHRDKFDRQRIHEVFDALQFRVLRERLFDYLDDDVEGAAESLEVVVDQLSAGTVRQWLADHACASSPESSDGATAIACEGQWGRGIGDLWSIALAAPDGATCWIDLAEMTPSDDAALADWLANPEYPKVMHDFKGQDLAMRSRGWQLAGVRVDTALAAYLALPGQRSFDLVDLVARFLGRTLDEDGGSGEQLSLDGTGASQAGQLGSNARAIADLAVALTELLAERDSLSLLYDIEMPTAAVLADLEEAGVHVDVPGLQGLEGEFAERMRTAEAEAHDLAGHEFNLGSPKQLQEVLFAERGLPKTKKIKTGHTTDAESLEKLFNDTGDPLLAELLTWRDVSRMRQTVAGLIPLADNKDRIHTTYRQTIAATGRLSSTDPNLQNIPIRTEEGRRIRAAFTVGEGYETLLTADYSQIEMRIMAHLSEDAGLIAAFESGEDLHSTVAASVFQCAPEDVDAEMRRRIKAMSYGLAYGLSAFGLSAQLGLTPTQASELMDEYFKRFGGIRDYLAEVVEVARQEGYTQTIFGRRRFLPDLNSDNRQRRQMAERMALNSPIQGSAADIIKLAMIHVQEAIAEAGLDSRMLLQVHDELVFEIAPGELQKLTDLVSDKMGSAADLSVPLAVSVGTGANWDSAAH